MGLSSPVSSLSASIGFPATPLIMIPISWWPSHHILPDINEPNEIKMSKSPEVFKFAILDATHENFPKCWSNVEATLVKSLVQKEEYRKPP